MSRATASKPTTWQWQDFENWSYYNREGGADGRWTQAIVYKIRAMDDHGRRSTPYLDFGPGGVVYMAIDEAPLAKPRLCTYLGMFPNLQEAKSAVEDFVKRERH